ncbi:hypothetical protein [Sulfuricurvum sp.]|uniref:hypothetical protein n=1 Tax=Sulfuricurvum sp. TaxID=2025608 RepID=UPI002621FD52|nr:hypothetical protein [Sulfuricurvum sp.]MDD3597652.1 hypothetical protein [Sulfuricurvum sp.]
MLILKTAALLATILALYRFIMWFNDFTYMEARHRFFTAQSFGWYAASYISIYSGYQMFISHWQGDTLNGAIVLIAGIWLFIIQIQKNFKRTPPIVALAGSLAQSILYIPLTVMGLILLFIALAAASKIRPVYTINGD